MSKQAFFIQHGTFIHLDGTKKKGEVLELDYHEAKEPLRQGMIKKYDPHVDKVIDYSKDATVDAKGRGIPSLEEYVAAGFSPEDHAAYVDKIKATAKAEVAIPKAVALSFESFRIAGLGDAGDYDRYVSRLRSTVVSDTTTDQPTKVDPSSQPKPSDLAPSGTEPLTSADAVAAAVGGKGPFKGK